MGTVTNSQSPVRFFPLLSYRYGRAWERLRVVPDYYLTSPSRQVALDWTLGGSYSATGRKPQGSDHLASTPDSVSAKFYNLHLDSHCLKVSGVIITGPGLYFGIRSFCAAFRRESCRPAQPAGLPTRD